jgi:hypothetical protein
MKIKRFKQFEAISGWELVGPGFGPGSPRQELAVTLSSSDTNTLMGFDGNFYTYDDYQSLYNDYMKSGGRENLSEFTESNLNLVLQFSK